MAILSRLVAVIFFIFLSEARAASSFEQIWDHAAKAVQQRKKAYERKSNDLGFQCCLGTIYNEVDVPEHRCAILGRMLNKTAFITQLEKPELGTGASAQEYAIAAHSLDNWLYNLDQLRKFAKAQRIKTWNLDCAGQMGIPTLAAISEKNIPTTFYTVENDGKVLKVLGDVELGFYSKLRVALEANQGIQTVALGSGGGLVKEALLAGLEIRKRHLETTVWSSCYSACTLVFLGGIQRTVWSPYPTLGFHQVSQEGKAVFDRGVYLAIADYGRLMGVKQKGLLELMLSASPDQMHSASLDELCEFRIATWVQRYCTAENNN